MALTLEVRRSISTYVAAIAKWSSGEKKKAMLTGASGKKSSFGKSYLARPPTENQPRFTVWAVFCFVVMIK